MQLLSSSPSSLHLNITYWKYCVQENKVQGQNWRWDDVWTVSSPSVSDCKIDMVWWESCYDFVKSENTCIFLGTPYDIGLLKFTVNWRRRFTSSCLPLKCLMDVALGRYQRSPFSRLLMVAKIILISLLSLRAYVPESILLSRSPFAFEHYFVY